MHLSEKRAILRIPMVYAKDTPANSKFRPVNAAMTTFLIKFHENILSCIASPIEILKSLISY